MAIGKDVLDRLVEGRDPSEVFARDGLLDDLKKALSERIVNAELDEHLEAERSTALAEPPLRPTNRRNGTSPKTVLTGTSKVRLAISRDRAGTFDPPAHRQVPAALPGVRRQDRLHVRARAERARDPRPPRGAPRDRRVAGPRLGGDGRGARGGGRLAEQAARRPPPVRRAPSASRSASSRTAPISRHTTLTRKRPAMIAAASDP